MHPAFSLRCPKWPLRVLLAWAMLVSPLSVARAKAPAAGTLDTKWLTAETVAAGYLRPRQVLNAENAELLPLEIFAAAGKKYLGIDPIDIKSVTVAVEPVTEEPKLAIVLEFLKPFDMANLSPEMTEGTKPTELKGKLYLEQPAKKGPSFYSPNESTLIIASDPMLRKLVAQDEKPQSSQLISEIKGHPATDDLYVAVDVESLRPLIENALAAEANQVPPPFQKYLQAPKFVRSAELALNLSSTAPPALHLYGNDESAAQALATLIDEGMAEARAQMAATMAMQQSADPVEQAMIAYSQRRMDQALNMLKPTLVGEKLMFFPTDPNNPNETVAQLQQIAVIGFFVALLLPAVQAAREAARRNSSMNNLNQLMLALLTYESANRAFPAHAIYSEDGKPLLSWRVQILPYIEEQALYEQFHLDEPWDSEHNKQLISKMPQVYLCPSSAFNPSDGKTTYLVPVGEGLIFDGTAKGARVANMADGMSNTIALVDAADDAAVIWTKPDDWEYDAKEPLKGLAPGHHPGIFNVGFADGSVMAVRLDINLDSLRAFFTKAGGEAVMRGEL